VENRADRKKVFSSFFEEYSKFQNTIGANLAGKVKNDYVYSKNRNYASTLEYGLSGPNIPVSVYENLINQIHKSLPTLHRFLDLKKRMLNLDTLHYYDLYTPIVKEVKMPFTVEEGQKVIKEALKPMGDEYLSTLQKAFDNRWIDYMPTAGKRSGAYSTGAAYDLHPYILTNWTGDYESVSTLAHELGHTMHSYFSSKNQSFPNSNYETFVAEIASTFNENLLNNYMVSRAKTKEEKLYLLGSYLELLRTTIFRQVLFAEFEWDIHKAVENGQSLTGEVMSDMYYKLVKQYYGNDEGKCVVDPYIAYEWEYIPHFINYTYYVFQYSTSIIYSTALAQKVLQEGKPAVDKYYNILKGGGSDYPIELIKKAGIDPLSSQPFELAMKKMNDVMDQIESILNQK
jgi:oligoendopeptidase F